MTNYKDLIKDDYLVSCGDYLEYQIEQASDSSALTRESLRDWARCHHMVSSIDGGSVDVFKMINWFETEGFTKANLNPLSPVINDIKLSDFGLDGTESYSSQHYGASSSEIFSHLVQYYCGTITLESNHVSDATHRSAIIGMYLHHIQKSCKRM